MLPKKILRENKGVAENVPFFAMSYGPTTSSPAFDRDRRYRTAATLRAGDRSHIVLLAYMGRSVVVLAALVFRCSRRQADGVAVAVVAPRGDAYSSAVHVGRVVGG